MRAIERFFSNFDDLPCAVAIHGLDGETTRLGGEDSQVEIFIRNHRGMRALQSLDQLAIVDAYVNGDIDMDGDVVEAMSFQDLLSDRHPWLKAWRRLKPLLVGRVRCNTDWIAHHYDLDNIQLVAADSRYNTYTPGIYVDEDDSLEDGAERKLDFAFESLRLEPGSSVLDVGCGWGGFLRYCASRGVRATGITLSRVQLEYALEKCREEGVEAEILYQDLFTYEPEERFDGIALMGVLEDLSDYARTLAAIERCLKPGGRVYMDFAAAQRRFGTASFVTKYVWPGTFRMVFLPELVQEITRSPFELVSVHNDRRNYHLWAKGFHHRWVERKERVLELADERVWRTIRILSAGTASVFDRASHMATAHRMVLELPSDAVPA